MTFPTPNLLKFISKVAAYQIPEGEEHLCVVSLVENPAQHQR